MPRRADELRLAFQLLTRLPVGTIDGDPPTMAASSWAWPIAGAAIGAIGAVVCGVSLWLGLPPAMAALLTLAVTALATGAMHEDGLADLADGFGGGRDKARKLEIMRDSRIGAYGVVALVLALGIRAAGIAAAADLGTAGAALFGLAAASRAVLPTILVAVPPARSDGLGHGAAGDDHRPAVVAGILGLACLLPLGLGAAVAMAAVIALATWAAAVLAIRQIGGQTGDVMGAIQQVAECGGWIALMVLL